MKKIVLKLITLVLISCLLGISSRLIGMSPKQSLSLAIFFASILGTLFFWDFRLSFAFIGTSILLVTKTIDLDHVLEFSSLEVILFLVGMMVIIGFLREAGFFAWIMSRILRTKNLSAKKFVLLICVLSALMSCAVDEVTSIIFMVAAVLEFCDYFEVNPVPYIIISVLATNIGSAGTVLGNPIGILIASKSGLTFEDFILKAFPLAMACLGLTILVVIFWYRSSLKKLDENIRELGANDILIKLISIPAERHLKVSMGFFVVVLFFISLHHRLEVAWGLVANTVLLVVPLGGAGCVMIWKHKRARKYIEKDVEWWTLLFFLLLFVQAGTLKYTGTTVFIAEKIIGLTGNNPFLLTSSILWISAIGSSILDNVVLVAAFIPVIQGFGALHVKLEPLWWALLFGGCFGGNITLIGSTANIVALGILEKEKNIRMTFLRWFGIGLTVGVLTTCVIWLALVSLPLYR
ncbi:MAG: SLC13 family permease [Candidatus Omnitrophica bacterium]|nr:SLC13 family permease [Candidatus Omnitrophota bacterium]